MWERIKQGKAGLGGLSIPHLPLSQVGPSRVPQGVLGPEGGFCRARGCWVFNWVVQAVVGLRNRAQRVVLGARQPWGEPRLQPPPCRVGEAQVQPFV